MGQTCFPSTCHLGALVAQHGLSRGSSHPVPVPALESVASGMVGRSSLESSILALGPWQGLAEPRCPHKSSVSGDPSFQGGQGHNGFLSSFRGCLGHNQGLVKG